MARARLPLLAPVERRLVCRSRMQCPAWWSPRPSRAPRVRGRYGACPVVSTRVGVPILPRPFPVRGSCSVVPLRTFPARRDPPCRAAVALATLSVTVIARGAAYAVRTPARPRCGNELPLGSRPVPRPCGWSPGTHAAMWSRALPEGPCSPCYEAPELAIVIAIERTSARGWHRCSAEVRVGARAVPVDPDAAACRSGRHVRQGGVPMGGSHHPRSGARTAQSLSRHPRTRGSCPRFPLVPPRLVQAAENLVGGSSIFPPRTRTASVRLLADVGNAAGRSVISLPPPGPRCRPWSRWRPRPRRPRTC